MLIEPAFPRGHCIYDDAGWTQAERTELPEKGQRPMESWVQRNDEMVEEAATYLTRRAALAAVGGIAA
jgi:hypothetical protein